jgi:hypothetical protein
MDFEPRRLARSAKSRKGQGKEIESPNESTGRTEYERLVQCPGSYISGSPIHRLAEELVVDDCYIDSSAVHNSEVWKKAGGAHQLVQEAVFTTAQAVTDET